MNLLYLPSGVGENSVVLLSTQTVKDVERFHNRTAYRSWHGKERTFREAKALWQLQYVAERYRCSDVCSHWRTCHLSHIKYLSGLQARH